MSQPNADESDVTAPQPWWKSPWGPPAIAGAVVLVLLIGLLAWLASRNDETITSATTETTTPTAPTTAVATTPTTSAQTSTTVAATAPPTTVPTTTPPATTAPPPPTTPTGPTGPVWTITSPYFPDDPFTLTQVAEVDDISAYDGTIAVAPTAIRCVAIVATGVESWSESCFELGAANNFVVLDGIDPVLVEVGLAPGDVTLVRQEPTWMLRTNGCTSPMSTLMAATPGGGSIGSPVTTGIVCVPDEAFVTIGSVFLQPGPADGGGALLTNGDEGWDSLGSGTSFGCADLSDGVDRCALYGVDDELFDAVLPIPPSGASTASTDFVAMTDETATATGWLGADELSPDAVDTVILGEVTDPDAEVGPTITRFPGLGGRLNLLVVDVPAMDDSILSTTWAAWISNDTPSAVVRMYSWQTCARGIAGPDVCL
jgi:hypothetical protein